MATRIQHRRGTAAQWAATNPVLADGELGFERDTKIVKVGDGTTNWTSLLPPFVSLAGGSTILASGAAVIPLKIRAAAGQTANLFETQDSSGTTLSRVSSTGRVFAPYFHVGSGGQSYLSGTVGDATAFFIANGPTAPGLTVRTAAAHTGNLAEFQNSTGTVMASVDKDGIVGSTSQIKVGDLAPNLGTYLQVVGQTAAAKGLVIRGTSGQAVSLAEFQNSAGTALTFLAADGQITAKNGVKVGDGNLGQAYLEVNNSAQPNVRGLVVRGAASQSANLAEFQNSAGTILAFVSATVGGSDSNLGLEWATLGQRRLQFGAPDSAGAGFRTVRIAN